MSLQRTVELEIIAYTIQRLQATNISTQNQRSLKIKIKNFISKQTLYHQQNFNGRK